MGNTFRRSIRELDQQNNNDFSMSRFQKKELFHQTKMYIFLQELIESIKKEQLNADETIRSFLPLTTDGGNLSSLNVGMMGLYHPKSEAAKKYVRDFHDLRGNRLLIFTDQRIIFMTIIEYLDQKLFYSYPYDKIHAITLKKNTLTYFDWSVGFPPARKKLYTYFFDFECEQAIFSELFTEKDGKLVLEQLEKNDGMKKITASEDVYRRRGFDKLLNNPLLSYRITKFISYGLIGLFLFFLAGLFLGFGPFYSLLQ